MADGRPPLGLPPSVRGCLFDMDGVLTKTATMHAAAWKEMFDAFLQSRGGEFEPFSDEDYERYVDGRTREDGTRAFLESRGVSLPEGQPDDSGEADGPATIYGLSNRKNRLVLAKIESDGVEVFDDTIAYVRALVSAGVPRAVVTASANATQVLAAAGIGDLFDARVDGVVAHQKHLAGKPAPDMYLAGADALGLEAGAAAVFEDALAGVEAGRNGNFAFVVGVDRVGQSEELKRHGADVVVTDVTELLGGAAR